MRIKARALGLAAEDYFNDKVLEDTDLLYSGITELPADFWDKHGKEMESWQQSGHTFYRVNGPLCTNFLVNSLFIWSRTSRSMPRSRSISGKTAVLQTLKDYTHQQKQHLGYHRAQPRAEFCPQSVDESGSGFRHPTGSGRYR